MKMLNTYKVKIISLIGLLGSIIIMTLHLLKIVAIDYVVLTCGYSMLILMLILITNSDIKSSDNAHTKGRPFWVWGLALLLVIISLAGAIHAYFNVSETPKEIPVELIIFLITTCLAILFILSVDFSEISVLGVGVKVKKDINTIKQRQIRNQVIKVAGAEEWFWIDDDGNQHRVDKITASFLSQERGIIAVNKDDQFNEVEPLPSFLKTAEPRFNDPDLFIIYNNVIYYQKTWSFVYKIASSRDIDVSDKDSWKKWKDNLGKLENKDLDNLSLR